jgi:hypothetical protein
MAMQLPCLASAAGDIPPLQHDWTLEFGTWLVGLVGYPSGTYVCYGLGYVWVPFTVETFGIVASIVFFAACLCFLQSCRRRSERP